MAKMAPDAPSLLMAHYPPHSAIPFFFSLIFGVLFYFFCATTWHFYHLGSLLCIPPFPPMSSVSRAASSRKSRSSKGKEKQRAPGPLPKQAPVNISDDGETAPSKGAPRIQWTHVRTERLLDWLEEHPNDRLRLFSDSSQSARKENQSQRVAKGPKSIFFTKIAHSIFSADPDEDVRRDLEAEPSKYVKAVENRISA